MKCSPSRFATTLSRFSQGQRVFVLETPFGSLLQMQYLKIDHDFCALLLDNFNLELRWLKVDGLMHILITESDVEKIFELHYEGLDVPQLTPWRPCTTQGGLHLRAY